MIEIFLDTANLKDIKKYTEWGIIKGVTTNQKIFSKEKGCDFEERSRKILEIMDPYPVSLEGPNDYQGIIDFAEKVEQWGSNAVVKVPMMGNGDGLRALHEIRDIVKTNVTACIVPNQAFLAASAGATYVSMFYGRIRDYYTHEQAVSFIKDTVTAIRDSDTQLIIGSVRDAIDVQYMIPLKPDVITIPPKILDRMPFHRRTEETLTEFEQAWEDFLTLNKPEIAKSSV